MKNQTPPVSTEQYAKLEQVVREIVRKGKISGSEFQHVLGHPDFVKELEMNINNKVAENRQKLAFTERPAWKTIQTGTHKSVNDLRQAVIDGDNRIGDWGGDILKRIKVANEETEIELFQATVAELGFTNGASWSDIKAKLDEFGFGICPAEVGPQLRLQYTDQPMDEWIWVVMDPVAGSDGVPRVFFVERNSLGRWLRGFRGRPDDVLGGGYRLVFRRK